MILHTGGSSGTQGFPVKNLGPPEGGSKCFFSPSCHNKRRYWSSSLYF